MFVVEEKGGRTPCFYWYGSIAYVHNQGGPPYNTSAVCAVCMMGVGLCLMNDDVCVVVGV